jgi:membrane associated rhomboid family serine protease/antitoxin component YwqK of YwqJK toxin-antitoxin module
MEFLKKIPATISLIVVNCLVFAWVYMQIGTFHEPVWSLGLLERGALYNPLTLNGEWYRLFTHMFLHGHLLHLLFNMYGLLVVGQEVERHAGTKTLLLVYFIGGLAAGLCSLYVNVFVPGVGASGAIFALFGFALVVNIAQARRENTSITPLLINFFLFLGINVMLAESLHADNAAHLGGAGCGVLMGIIFVLYQRPFVLAGMLPILIITFFILPRYQVRYFNFFQKVLEAQDSSNYVVNNPGKRSNEEFLRDYRRVTSKWDTALSMLNAEKYLPAELLADTFRLRNVIRFEKAKANYRSIMIGNESYIYADSIAIASDSIRKYTTLDYVLNLKYTPPDTSRQEEEGPPLETVKIWYDSNWVEVPYPPAAYFRIGQRDTSGIWQGPLADYYNTGIIQMKGTYKDDAKNGIFIYYTESGGYSAAGIYNNDERVGKWETFHPNGKIESEVYYGDRYFLKSYWDSTGVQMVTNGNGREIHRYPNGVVAVEGNYVDGYQDGYWYGRHQDGSMYFEENYVRGRLISGRSRNRNGRTAVYDASIFFALPEGGYKKLNQHIRSQIAEPEGKGTVKLSFRVTVTGQITDLKVEQSVSKDLDLRAKQIILSGPRWLPARLHGLEPTDGFAFVSVEF